MLSSRTTHFTTRFYNIVHQVDSEQVMIEVLHKVNKFGKNTYISFFVFFRLMTALKTHSRRETEPMPLRVTPSAEKKFTRDAKNT